jgi:WD40 repeat protein
VHVIEAIESPQLSATLKGHGELVWQVAWSPDGKTLASLSTTESVVKLWDVGGRKERATLRSDLGDSYSLAFTPDGNGLALAHWKSDRKVGPTGGISLWDTSTGQRKGLLQHTLPRGVDRLVLSPDGKTLAASETWKEGDKDQYTRGVTLWDIASGKAQANLADSSINALTFSPDGKILVRSGYTIKDNRLDAIEIRRFDLTTGKDLSVLSNIAGKNPIQCLAFSPDGRTLAGAYLEGDVVLWDTSSTKVRTTIKQDDQWSVTSLAFSPDGKTLAGAVGHRRGRDHEPGLIVLWDAASGQRRLTLTGHTNAVLSVAFSPNGKILASGSSDRTVRLWDMTARPTTVGARGSR